jgi:hypothetical protein
MYLTDERSRCAIEVSERFADGGVLSGELGESARLARAAALLATGHDPKLGDNEELLDLWFEDLVVHGNAEPAAAWAALWVVQKVKWAWRGAWAAMAATAKTGSNLEEHCEEVGMVQATLLRDVIGNPFRPVSLNPSWLTTIVTNIATAAYEERILPSGELDPARLAVLCDALLDAGCPADHEVLLHLRGEGVHVRGCAAVDAILGRQ